MTQADNARPWHVQARRGNDDSWVSIPGEQYARREQAQHRMTVFSGLLTDAHFRVVHVRILPRETGR